MGLIAGKSTYAVCLGKTLNATNDGPLQSDPYINFAVPVEMLEIGKDVLDAFTDMPGGVAFSDLSGTHKDSIQIMKGLITPEVQSDAMLEGNAIRETLDSWLVIAHAPIYFFWDMNGSMATFTDFNSNINKYLKCGLIGYKLKGLGNNLFEINLIIRNRDY